MSIVVEEDGYKDLQSGPAVGNQMKVGQTISQRSRVEVMQAGVAESWRDLVRRAGSKPEVVCEMKSLSLAGKK